MSANTRGKLAVSAGPDGFLEVSGVVEVPDAQLWWPHTHGTPRTYRVTMEAVGVSEHLGSVGFRTVEVEQIRWWIPFVCQRHPGVLPWFGVGADRPDLASRRRRHHSCLGTPGRGGTEHDSNPGDDGLRERPLLGGMRATGHSRVAGHDVGDARSAPTPDEFFELVAAEVTAFLHRVRGNPALAVFCGGSETEQQPTMLGLVDQHIPLIHSRLPELISTVAPELEYVTSSPSAPRGGEQLATHVGSGVAHYFGVGAYRRPLADVLSARVRFATESLAFSIPPSNAVIENEFGSLAVAGHHPAWKAAVPRDNGIVVGFRGCSGPLRPRAFRRRRS